MKKRLRKKWHLLQCAHWNECIGIRYSDCILCKHFSLSKKTKRGYYSFHKKTMQFTKNIKWEDI